MDGVLGLSNTKKWATSCDMAVLVMESIRFLTFWLCGAVRSRCCGA